jgi:rhodanese-related sulfurtransferase
MEKSGIIFLMKRVQFKYLLIMALLASFPGVLLIGAPAEGGEGGTEGVNAAELKSMIDNGEDLTIIDVRTPEEYNGGHIPGSISVPINTIKDFETLPYDGKVVLYCTAGVRSSKASKIFASKGVEELMDLKGGIRAWEKSGGEVITDKDAAFDKEEEIEYFTGLPKGATVPRGVCEIDYAPSMVIGGEEEGE